MDETCFDFIWEHIILLRCNRFQDEYGGLAFDKDYAKREIYQYYDEIRKYTKLHYMSHREEAAEKRINRYKLAAALMIAILKTKPIKKAELKFYKDFPEKWIFNESLALYVGMMIIRSFMLSDISEKKPSDIYVKIVKGAFEKQLPLNIRGRNYWENELYFLRQEGSYNVLSIAHELEDFVKIALYRQASREIISDQMRNIYDEIDTMVAV